MQGSSSTESLATPALDGTSAGANQLDEPFDAAPLQSHLERLLQLLLGAQERECTLLFAASESVAALRRFALDENQKSLYINKLLLEANADDPGSSRHPPIGVFSSQAFMCLCNTAVV